MLFLPAHDVKEKNAIIPQDLADAGNEEFDAAYARWAKRNRPVITFCAGIALLQPVPIHTTHLLLVTLSYNPAGHPHRPPANHANRPPATRKARQFEVESYEVCGNDMLPEVLEMQGAVLPVPPTSLGGRVPMRVLLFCEGVLRLIPLFLDDEMEARLRSGVTPVMRSTATLADALQMLE